MTAATAPASRMTDELQGGAPISTNQNDASTYPILKPTSAKDHVYNEQKSLGILRLPNEVLELIALNLREHSSIFQLALVNKLFHTIVQEVLIRKLVIPTTKIQQCIKILLENRSLRTKTICVNLGDYGHPHINDRKYEDDSMDYFLKICDQLSGPQHRDAALEIPRQDKYQGLQHKSFWSLGKNCYLSLLFAICRNTRHLTVQLPPAPGLETTLMPTSSGMILTRTITNPKLVPATLVEGPALELLQRQLRTLTISEDTKWRGPMQPEFLRNTSESKWRTFGRPLITLTGFDALTHLDIPMEYLGCPEFIVFGQERNRRIDISAGTDTESRGSGANKPSTEKHLSKGLPTSLTTLTLRSCNHYTFGLLGKIHDTPPNQTKLRHIELHFQTCARATILRCYIQDLGELPYPRIMKRLNRRGIQVTSYMAKKETPFDLGVEVAAMWGLSKSEVAMVAHMNLQFSNMNPIASLRRRLSNIESRLLLKHGHHYLRLFNSSTFNEQVWRNIAFFHGRVATYNIAHISHRYHKKTATEEMWGDRANGRLNHRLAKRDLLDISLANFNFHVDNPCKSESSNVLFLGRQFTFEDNKRERPYSACPDVLKRRKYPSQKTLNGAKERTVKDSPRRCRAKYFRAETTEEDMRDGTISEASGELFQKVASMVIDSLDDDRMCLDARKGVPRFAGRIWLGVPWKKVFQP